MPTFWKHKNILIQGENILIYRKKHQQSKRIKRTALHDLNWKDGLQKTNSSIDLVYDVFLRFFFSYVSFGGWRGLKPGQSVWRNSKSPYLSRDASLRLNSIVNIDSEKKQLVSEYKGIDTWKWQSTSLLVSCSGTKIIVGSTMYSLRFTISHHQQYNIILM